LHKHGLSVTEIRVSTGLSERLIGEYLELYKTVGCDNLQVQRILSEADPATEKAADIKRGAWLR